MNFLLDPNVAYLFLVIGFFLAILSLFSPGTGLIEIGALFALIVAGWAVYNIPINLWALAVLVLGVFPFLLAVRKSKRWYFLVVALAALVIGSIFLFREESGKLAVNPLLATLVSAFTTVFLWFATRKSLEAMNKRPAHNWKDLVGKIGVAKTRIDKEGTVYINGENWSAYSQSPIPKNTKVRIINRDGFILEVEPFDTPKSE
jgi:membrane-bound serine protease (ClpP class)